MSRTIRRLKPGKYKKRKVEDYLNGKEGKESDQTFWKFYTDNGLPGFGFEDAYEYPYEENGGSKRGAFKLELIKWWKNPDHEVQYSRFKQLWDYC